MAELDAFDPIPEQIKLSNGTLVLIEPLKARQFFKLLRIVTHGALPVIQDLSLLNLDADTDEREFTTRFVSLMLLSIPDAEDETIEFVRSMCKPVGLVEGRKLNKVDSERNATRWTALDAELENPELDDLVTIIEAIVRREAADIQALGKRLAVMLRLAERTGQLDPSLSPTSTVSTSSDRLPGSTTFSPASTDGPTPTSTTSPSDAFASALPLSESVSTTSGGVAING